MDNCVGEREREREKFRNSDNRVIELVFVQRVGSERG